MEVFELDCNLVDHCNFHNLGNHLHDLVLGQLVQMVMNLVNLILQNLIVIIYLNLTYSTQVC